MGRVIATAWLAAAMLAAGSGAVANAAPAQLCTEWNAAWDGDRCSALITSQHGAQTVISLRLPAAMLADPTAGPVLRDFYTALMTGWRSHGAQTPRDNTATSEYQIYPGPGAVQSVVVHETLAPHGIQANNAYRTFVFDMAAGRELRLDDLFKPGVDPNQAIAPAAAAVLPPVLDAAQPPHSPGTYPFTVQEWQPGPDGPRYSGDYRAWGLAADHLVLYMPDEPMLRGDPSPRDRFVWSMDGGTVIAKVPLASMAEALRPEYGGA